MTANTDTTSPDRSTCHNATVTIARWGTHFYVCNECNKPCDITVTTKPDTTSPVESLRSKLEVTLVKFETTTAEAFGYQEGYTDKEPEPYDVQECASDLLAAFQQYIQANCDDDTAKKLLGGLSAQQSSKEPKLIKES